MAILCGPPACAQTRPDPFGQSIVAIRAHRIETISHGTIDDGVVVIRGGKIIAAGANVKVPVGARVLQAECVMPGMIGVYSQMGVSPGVGTAARSEPHLRVADELYPGRQLPSPRPRRSDHASRPPAGRGFPGQGAIVRRRRNSAQQMPLTEYGPLAIDFAPNTQTIGSDPHDPAGRPPPRSRAAGSSRHYTAAGRQGAFRAGRSRRSAARCNRACPAC